MTPTEATMGEPQSNVPAHGLGNRPLLPPYGRLRTWLPMLLALAAYAAVNVFWQYLATGDWRGGLGNSLLSYGRALVVPLGDILQRPLSIFSYPWMIPVIGLLLGVVVFVPILIAVLYRLPYVVLFLLVVGLVGNAPVLAMTLGLGCFLAAVTPLRSNMPLVACLLGLSPAALYLALASFASGDAATLTPIQRGIPYAPMAIALGAAILASVVVLGVARLTKYRPGVVCPVLLIVTAVPIWLFFSKVGQAELDYALVVDRMDGPCTVFDPARVETWSREQRVEGLSDQRLRNRVAEKCESRRRGLIAACDRFLARHAGSPHVGAVLWLKGQCQDLQLDERALETGTIRMTDTWPMPASREAWQLLTQDHSSDPQAAIAHWRLGELALREANAKEARRQLQLADDSLRAILSVELLPADAERSPRLFEPVPPLPARAQYEQALQEVRQLLWLMDQNDVIADAASAEAMAAWRSCNPCQGDCYGQLRSLLADRACDRSRTRLGNNIKLDIAKLAGDLDAMKAIAADTSDFDAAVQASIELGRLAMQKPWLVEQARLQPAATYFRKVMEGPDNPWRSQVAQWLLPATRPPSTEPE